MPIQSFSFGFDSFKVENCRSKGLHNDSDWLILTVTSGQTGPPTQHRLLGRNLHAGDSVAPFLLGPFDVDTSKLVTVTFAVVNFSHTDDQENKAAEVALAVEGGIMALAGVGFGIAGEITKDLSFKIAGAILSAVGGVLATIGGVIGIEDPNPDCDGEVFTRVMPFLPGELRSQLIAFPFPETAQSPSECGGDPHTSVVYAVRQAVTQQHIFYRDVNNEMQHIFFDMPSGRLLSDNWIHRVKELSASGNPATMVTPGQQHLFYRGAGDGSIRHIFFDRPSNQLFHDNWTDDRTKAPASSGDPATMVTPGQQHVFYRDDRGAIHHIFFVASTNQLLHDIWTERVQGAAGANDDPATMVTPDQQHIFYLGGGHIHHIFFDVPSNQLLHDIWTQKVQAVKPVTRPATMVTATQQHIFYKGVDGSLQHIFFDVPTNQLLHDSWTDAPDAVLLAGKPTTMVTTGQQHVFYRGVDDAIHHVFFTEPTGPLLRDNWTASTKAPAAAGDPVTMVTPNQQHIFYMDQNRQIQHIFFDGGLNQLFNDNWTDPKRLPGSPLSVSDPATMVTGDA